eukprot:sb/3473318/
MIYRVSFNLQTQLLLTLKCPSALSSSIISSYTRPGTSKQPIRTRYLGHVTGYQPIRDYLVFSGSWLSASEESLYHTNHTQPFYHFPSDTYPNFHRQWTRNTCSTSPGDSIYLVYSSEPIRTRYLGHVTGCQPIRDQCFLIRCLPLTYHIEEHG